jgi:predicted nucleic acid-binding protein
MIAYFDSSSIVKWFFDEPFAEMARGLKEQTRYCFTSLISYPEVMFAFRRACREGRCLESEKVSVKDEFIRIWPEIKWVKLSSELVRRAGELVFKHELRSFDAVHLSSALSLSSADPSIELFFSCFDRNLNRAAIEEGFRIHELSPDLPE